MNVSPGTSADLPAEARRVLVPRRRIADRVAALAEEIARDFRGGDLTVLAVLTGSIVFLADLIRRLPVPLRVDAAWVRSYPGQSVRSRGARLILPPGLDVAGKDVLIVDDILDTGRTLDRLRRTVARSRPASLRTCVLVRKDRPDLPSRLCPDFVGFDIPDRFVVGYGLDFDGRYRNLPDICVLKRHWNTEAP